MVDEAQRHRSGYGGVDLRDPNPGNNPLEGFHTMSGRTDQFERFRNGNTVNDTTRDFWTADNPQTGTRYTSTNVDTPNWSYERFTDPGGFGQERWNSGDFKDFWLKGGGQDYMGLPVNSVWNAGLAGIDKGKEILDQYKGWIPNDYDDDMLKWELDNKYGQFDIGLGEDKGMINWSMEPWWNK